MGMLINAISLIISIAMVCVTILFLMNAPDNDYIYDNMHEKDKLRELFESYTIKE